jgi:bifunctional non-homologous end joining protein LigD
MIFDLDPYIYAGTEKKGEEPALNRKAFEKAREIAFSLKDVLQQLRLSSFVKTTGKTGLHIYVPVLRQYDYSEIRAAAEALGRYMLQLHPKDLTMEWAVEKRTGKIFFDHGQNTRGKTLAAQYSLRPTPWAGVSMPVLWSELTKVDPPSFTLSTVPDRLAKSGDPWRDILDYKNDVTSLLAG